MSSANTLNDLIATHHPAAARCLSTLGRQIYYPSGVPAQAAQAAGTRINATIGQVTDGRGHAMPLAALQAVVGGGVAPNAAFLYPPASGYPGLRRAWRDHQRHPRPAAVSLPLVTGGLTHSLSLIADLFADPGTPVLVPSPRWDNYDHIFGLRRGARMVPYRLMHPDGGLDLEAIEAALQSVAGRPAVLVLNLPSNPVGYSPTLAEAAALVTLIRGAQGPLVVALDDAYAGLTWEEGILERSLFHDLVDADPERILAVKVDGATKELFFFSGRVAFLTFGVGGVAGEALEEKARATLRATVSSPSGLSQAVVEAALADPDLPRQQAELRAMLGRRYRLFRDALQRRGLTAWPFNSAYFALLPVPGDAHALRHRLIAAGIGVVATPEVGAIRLSYASTHEDDIEELVTTIADHLERAPEAAR